MEHLGFRQHLRMKEELLYSSRLSGQLRRRRKALVLAFEMEILLLNAGTRKSKRRFKYCTKK